MLVVTCKQTQTFRDECVLIGPFLKPSYCMRKDLKILKADTACCCVYITIGVGTECILLIILFTVCRGLARKGEAAAFRGTFSKLGDLRSLLKQGQYIYEIYTYIIKEPAMCPTLTHCLSMSKKSRNLAYRLRTLITIPLINQESHTS